MIDNPKYTRTHNTLWALPPSERTEDSNGALRGIFEMLKTAGVLPAGMEFAEYLRSSIAAVDTLNTPLHIIQKGREASEALDEEDESPTKKARRVESTSLTLSTPRKSGRRGGAAGSVAGGA